jgi:hypothetical protein
MKPRGRPTVDPRERSVSVTVTLPAAQYDALCKKALHDQLSVPEVIRRELTGNKKLKTSLR